MNPSAKPAPENQSIDCLARQPILNKDEKVLGYELLFREGAEEEHFSSDYDGGTRTIIDTLNIMGLDVVCDGRTAFINCTHDMLLKEFFLLLPAEKAVVEIQETVPVEEAVVAACQQLKMEGYRIALDNFVHGDPREKLMPTPITSRLTSGGFPSNTARPLSQDTAPTVPSLRKRLRPGCSS